MPRAESRQPPDAAHAVDADTGPTKNRFNVVAVGFLPISVVTVVLP
jgi:hypothetical protein